MEHPNALSGISKGQGNQRDIVLVKSPVSAGLVRSLSYDEEFGQDYESEHYDAAIDAVWKDFETFRVGEIDPEDVSSKNDDRWTYMPEKRAGMKQWDDFVRARLVKKEPGDLA